MTVRSDVAKFSYSFAFTKAVETEDQWIVEGIASTEDIDREADVITQEAVEKGMEEYMSNAIVLWMHDHDDPVGKVVHWTYMKAGLMIKVSITKTQKMVDRWKLIVDGVVKAFSISGSVEKSVEVKQEDQLVRKATAIDIWEISIVSVPANKSCLFRVISKAAKGLIIEEGVKLTKDKKEEIEEEVVQVKVEDLEELKKNIADLKEEIDTVKKEPEDDEKEDEEDEEEEEKKKKSEDKSISITKTELKALVQAAVDNQPMHKAVLEDLPSDDPMTEKTNYPESLLVKGLMKNAGLKYKPPGVK